MQRCGELLRDFGALASCEGCWRTCRLVASELKKFFKVAIFVGVFQ